MAKMVLAVSVAVFIETQFVYAYSVPNEVLVGTYYMPDCSPSGVYWRGQTQYGNLQQNCGSAQLAPSTPSNSNPVTIQDSSGFNNVFTGYVNFVTQFTVYGCRDPQAINYVASSTDASGVTCLYAFKQFDVPFVDLPGNFHGTTEVYPQISGTVYGTSTYDGTPYWYATTTVVSPFVHTRYPFTTPISYMYFVANSPLNASNYVRTCGGQASGSNGGTVVGTGFHAPDNTSIYVTRFYNATGDTCTDLEGLIPAPSLSSGTKIFAIIGTNDSNLIFNSWSDYTGYVSGVQSGSISNNGSGYLDATSTLPTCGSLDVGCYVSNALQYVFVPSPASITKFKSLSLASSSPFSYAYDVGNLRTELFNTSTTTTLGISVNVRFSPNATSTLTFISKSMIEAVPYSNFIRTLIGWLLWLMLIEVIYYQVLKAHNKETQTT